MVAKKAVKKVEVKKSCHAHCACSALTKALGLYAIVSGFLIHWTSGPIWNNWQSAVLYLVGFMLFGIGKKLVEK